MLYANIMVHTFFPLIRQMEGCFQYTKYPTGWLAALYDVLPHRSSLSVLLESLPLSAVFFFSTGMFIYFQINLPHQPN